MRPRARLTALFLAACSACLLPAGCGSVPDGATEDASDTQDTPDTPDTGQPSADTGATPDTGAPVDAGNDTGVALDAGGDTGAALDAGGDTGAALDTGAAVDGGTDAGAADAGRDAGPGDTGAPDAGPARACSTTSPVGTSGIAFDGVDDHVAMGVARSLGLQRFTVEAWVRRDGAGAAAGTGAGGLGLVPIAGKGRGESDGSTVDCNYAFGFFGDVLGADFEDRASGLNHPVVGRTAVPLGEWHHVAATYDGAAWRLYLDGRLDGQATAGATPRYDSVQHFALGTLMNSTGVPAGRLRGALDEVRVWNVARSASDIAANMYRTVPRATGLVGRWALDITETGAPDTAGTTPGTLAGSPRRIRPAAALDLGVPPSLSMPTPAPGTAVAGATTTIGVTASDPDSRALAATFHVREITAEDDFTVVVLPDTQYYTIEGDRRERYFYDQTRWIMANRARYNIVGVIHNGDVVQNGDRYEYQWTVADRAMRALEARATDLPDGLPYGLAVGNHDQTPIGTTGSTNSFNRFFGVSRFASRAYYGGHYGDRNDESWFTFSAGGRDFLVVSVQYDPTQDPAVVAWARNVLRSHPDAFAIVNAHYIVGGDGGFGAQGRALYDGLRGEANLRLMTNGHIHGEARRNDTYEGRVVHSMLADYQGRANGGDGWLRIWEFSPASNELTVRTYSPTLDRFEMDANSEFTIPIDLTGTGRAFTVAGTVDPAAPGAIRATLARLAPGRTYEWYAAVSDCVHTARSPVYRLRTR